MYLSANTVPASAGLVMNFVPVCVKRKTLRHWYPPNANYGKKPATEKEDASPLISAQRELWEETGYGKGNWQEYMVISANPSTHTNLTYCFLATDVELIDHQHLEATEDLSVHLLTLEEVKRL